MLRKLLKKEVIDVYAQENFVRLEDYIREEPILKTGFKFLSMTLEAPSYPATVSYPHRLGFLPMDVIVTRNIGSYTLEYDDFTDLTIAVTITGPVELRMFVGTYAEGRTI